VPDIFKRKIEIFIATIGSAAFFPRSRDITLQDEVENQNEGRGAMQTHTLAGKLSTSS
jgi:hypothetical protein